MSKQDKDMGNVHQLHPDKATNIEPPDGYAPPSGMYMQAAGGVPLVRLFDVFEWLQRDGRMPGKAAAAAICDALQPLAQEACEWLFTGLSNDYASPVDAQAPFCTCVRVFSVGGDDWDGCWPCHKCQLGVAGLLDGIGSMWHLGGDVAGDEVTKTVCLSQAKAHELWCWGRVVDVEAKSQAAPAMVPPAPEAKPITTWKEAAELHKHQSDGGKKPAWTYQKLDPIVSALMEGVAPKEIAIAAGIKRQTLEEVVKKYQTDPAKYGAPSPIPSVGADKQSAGVDLQRAWGATRTR